MIVSKLTSQDMNSLIDFNLTYLVLSFYDMIQDFTHSLEGDLNCDLYAAVVLEQPSVSMETCSSIFQSQLPSLYLSYSSTRYFLRFKRHI